ncbi:unnamed protein product [Ceratitis capitata]|uniref:(Mediterranean fruit fly) hypothetical protein n=1 Tax=Ceratitis capitata TaxID=7213 RepID=A0A811VJX7_CERCA|nr:unnamed protein product [Ceratitis capitata]
MILVNCTLTYNTSGLVGSSIGRSHGWTACEDALYIVLSYNNWIASDGSSGFGMAVNDSQWRNVISNSDKQQCKSLEKRGAPLYGTTTVTAPPSQ